MSPRNLSPLLICVTVCLRVFQKIPNPHPVRRSISIQVAINIEERRCAVRCCVILVYVCVSIGVKGVYLCLFADAGWAERCVKVWARARKDFLMLQKNLRG